MATGRRSFVRTLFESQVVDGLRPILLLLLAMPFILPFIVAAALAGYVVAGDLGGGIGCMAGLFLGVAVGRRYYERVEAKLSTGMLILLTLIAAGISLSFDYVPGGLVLAIVSFSAMGIGLIVWSGSPTADSRPTAEADGRFSTEPAEDQKPAANQPTR